MSHKLLIIEDDYSLNQMLTLHFEDQGYTVTGVDNCAAGLAQLQQQAFDFVLLDQQHAGEVRALVTRRRRQLEQESVETGDALFSQPAKQFFANQP